MKSMEKKEFEMKNRTTREHYEKYAELKERFGVFFDPAKNHFGLTKDQIVEKFKADKHLNSIPLGHFDCWSVSFMVYNQNSGLSIAECCCLAKHCLIYDVICATPEFK